MAVYRVAAKREQTDHFISIIQNGSAGISVGCRSACLENGSATRSLFLCGDLAVVNSCFERRFTAEQSRIEGVCRAWITDNRDVILELNFRGVPHLQNRCVFHLDLDNGDVFPLIVTFAGRRAILLDFEWERAAVRDDDVVKKLEALEGAVLVDKTRIQTARVLADLFGDLLDELPEERLFCFVFTVVSRGDDVRVGGDVAI